MQRVHHKKALVLHRAQSCTELPVYQLCVCIKTYSRYTCCSCASTCVDDKAGGGGGRDASGSNSQSESQWNAGCFQPKGKEFSGNPGIQVTVNGTTSLDYFKLFFTDNILGLLVTEINHYSVQCIEAAPKPLPKYSYLALWVPVTRTDMTVFIALLINRGIVN